MADELRGEFEEYVKKLTTAICKDIFLRELKDLYGRYETEYKKYAEVSSNAENASRNLSEEVSKVTAFLKKTEENTKWTTKSLEGSIRKIEGHTFQLFQELKRANEEKNAELLSGLASHIEVYKDELARIFSEGYSRISDKLAGVITPEILQDFLTSLDENTRETKELASFIDGEYKQEIEKSIAGIIENNRKAMEVTNADVTAIVKKMEQEMKKAQSDAVRSIERKTAEYIKTIEDKKTAFQQYLEKMFQEEHAIRSKELQKQKELIRQIGPSDEKMNELKSKVARLEQLVNEMEKKNESANQKMRTAFDEQLKVQGQFGKEQVARLEQMVSSMEKKCLDSLELTRSRSDELLARTKAVSFFQKMMAIIFGLVCCLGCFSMYGVAGFVASIAVLILAAAAFRFGVDGFAIAAVTLAGVFSVTVAFSPPVKAWALQLWADMMSLLR